MRTCFVLLLFRLRTFTDEEIKEIKNVTLRDIILAVTNIAPEEIPQDVFRWLNDTISNYHFLYKWGLKKS